MTQATDSSNAAAASVPAVLAWARNHLGSLLFVILPTFLAAAYFLLAADQYASETSFIVRSPSRTQTTGLAGLLQTTGIGHAEDDTFAVHNFILSRDALAKLQQDIDVRSIYNRPEGDVFAVYPNVIYRNTFEEFYKYYLTRVEVSYDTTTDITTLTAKAFRADDARNIADTLLAESEKLINLLNERSRDNAVREAQTDVEMAEQRITGAQQATLAYRNRESLLDPGKSSGAIFETASKLRAELAATQIRLAEIQRTSPDNPMRQDLETHIAALSRQVDEEQDQLVGSGASMAPKITEYEKLMLQQEFASKDLASALASLESARADARRQQIYLERIVAPNTPDKAEFPRRLRAVLVVLISCFLAYSTARLLLAGIREHSQT